MPNLGRRVALLPRLSFSTVCRRCLSDRQPRPSIWDLPPPDPANPTSFRSGVSSRAAWTLKANYTPALPWRNKGGLSEQLGDKEKTLKRETEEDAADNSWRQRKVSTRRAYPEGWKPTRKLSPDAMNIIRTLKQEVIPSSITF
jgi:hypothetical protein